MKKLLTGVLTFGLISGTSMTLAHATPKAGAACAKAGSTAISAGKKFTCIKSGKKLVWNGGTALPVAPKPFVAPALSPETAFAPTSDCKLSKPSNHQMDDGPQGSVGFPKNPNAFASIGNIKALVITADFADVPATIDLTAPWKSSSIPNAEKLFTYASYGKFNVKVDITEKVYRLQKPSSYYELLADPSGGPLPGAPAPKIDEVILDAMAAADSDIDFTKYAFVAVTTPASPTLALSGATGLGRIPTKFDGVEYVQGDFVPYDSLTPLDKPYRTLNFAHDIGHMLGLLHPYNVRGEFKGAWDIMWSFAFQNDFLGWNKWKLSWITDQQISCINGSVGTGLSQLLSPIGTPTDSKKLVVIKVDDNHAIAIEVRRKSPFENLKSSDEGVIVYTVDTTKSQGEGPYEIVSNPTKTMVYQNFPEIIGTMKPGEKVTIGGYVISVIGSTSDGDYVSVTKSA